MIEIVKSKVKQAQWTLLESKRSMFCTIFDTGQYSAFILALYYFTHHTKLSSDIRAGCTKIAGFVASYQHRASLCIMTSLLSKHRYWLSFANCESTILSCSVNANSTRLLECSVFSRSLLFDVYHLCRNWPASLPNLYNQLSKISCIQFDRGSNNDDSNEEAVETLLKWNSSISKYIDPMLTIAIKYFRDIDIQIGWSLALVVDPIVSASVAKGILLGINACGVDVGAIVPETKISDKSIIR
jgi:hypothetical protein